MSIETFDSHPGETTQFEINKNRLTFEIKNEKLRKSITVTTSNSSIYSVAWIHLKSSVSMF